VFRLPDDKHWCPGVRILRRTKQYLAIEFARNKTNHRSKVDIPAEQVSKSLQRLTFRNLGKLAIKIGPLTLRPSVRR